MIKREFEALICEDFIDKWYLANSIDENTTVNASMEIYGDPELEALSKRISGNVVVVTENVYPIGDTDYFEREDNNYVIYKELFKEIL